jgi:LAS superfamily LD-carboxypeptidase LdcB
MKNNSMLYGWFLPAWAQQNGSKPEPWHWEFAG